ncbi:MAG: hypothetical protein AAF907_17185, partial [Planctomycetota bacterium]
MTVSPAPPLPLLDSVAANGGHCGGACGGCEVMRAIAENRAPRAGDAACGGQGVDGGGFDACGGLGRGNSPL